MDPALSLYSDSTRYFAFDDSDYLIVEQANSAQPMSAETAREIQAVGAHASAHSVLLWNADDQIEGVFDLDQIARVPIKDFSPIRAVGVAPELGHRLGKWERQQRREDGLWSVVLEPFATRGDPVGKVFEEQILVPWIARRVEGKPGSQWVEIEMKQYQSLVRAQENMRRVIEKFVLVPGNHDISVVFHRGAGKTATVRQLLQRLVEERQIRHFVITSGEEIKRLQQQVTRVSSSHAKSIDAVISDLENTTQALNAVSDTPSSTKTTEPEPVSDPIQNAIDIREQLKRNVRLLDAAKWAKWRGTRSKNPSAALGKYKNQSRLFAVRVGNRDLYPAFQFSDNAEPLPVIEEILKVVPKDAQGWPLLSWFEAGNAVLGSRKPSELISSAPSKVLRAAGRFYSRDD